MKGFELHWSDTDFNQILWAQKISKEEFPFEDEAEEYTTFYKVVTRENNTVLYLKKGYAEAPNQIVPVYKNGKGHGGFASNMKAAVKLAVKAAIYYI